MRIAKSVQALTPYVPGEQPKSRNVVKLNTNENPYPPSEAIVEDLVAEGVDNGHFGVRPYVSEYRAAGRQRVDGL